MSTLRSDFSRALIFPIGASLVLAAMTASATDITWNGSESDDWNNPTNWTPQTVPTSGDHVILSGGYVTMAPGASFSVMDWTDGTIAGSPKVPSNAVLNITGSREKGLCTDVLTNAGTIVWSGTGDFLIGTNVIYNLEGALFDMQNNQAIYMSVGGVINNAGAFRKSAGTGLTYIEPQFNNSGTLEVYCGEIQLWGGYSGTPSANLATSIGSTDPAVGFGLIYFGDGLTMTGRFTVSLRDGFRPDPGDTFYAINYPSATGDFVCMNGLDQGNGLRLKPKFGATQMTLTAFAYPTSALPGLDLLHSAHGLVVLWPPEFSGWKLYSTTNLATRFWSTVPVAGTNNTVVPIIGPDLYFRLSKTNN